MVQVVMCFALSFLDYAMYHVFGTIFWNKKARNNYFVI